MGNINSQSEIQFKVEYAKSGRADCKVCRFRICEKGSLRFGVVYDSAHFDGKETGWIHPECFLNPPPQRIKMVEEIEGFQSLREDHQEFIRTKFGAFGPRSEFLVVYTPTQRCSCVICKKIILKGAVRISNKDFTSSRATLISRFKGLSCWHHVGCFLKVYKELNYITETSTLSGFENLSDGDKHMLHELLPDLTALKTKENDDDNQIKAPNMLFKNCQCRSQKPRSKVAQRLENLKKQKRKERKNDKRMLKAKKLLEQNDVKVKIEVKVEPDVD